VRLVSFETLPGRFHEIQRVTELGQTGLQGRRAVVLDLAREAGRGVFLHLAIQQPGLRHRLDLQLLLQDLPAAVELRQRGGETPRREIATHHLAMDVLLQRIEGQQSLAVGDGLLERPAQPVVTL